MDEDDKIYGDEGDVDGATLENAVLEVDEVESPTLSELIPGEEEVEKDVEEDEDEEP